MSARKPVQIGPLINHAGGNGDPDMGHTTDGGYVYGITSHCYEECADYGCRRVVAIGTSWQDALNFAHDMQVRQPGEVLSDIANGVHRAIKAAIAPIRSFEPQRMGAVVEQSNGARWVRTGTDGDGDWVNSDGIFAKWDDIVPALPISDGVR